MTEPNEPPPPLTRMRFSWQRGSGRPSDPDEEPTAPSVPGSGPGHDEVADHAGSPPRDVPAYWEDDAAPPSAAQPAAPPAPPMVQGTLPSRTATATNTTTDTTATGPSRSRRNTPAQTAAGRSESTRPPTRRSSGATTRGRTGRGAGGGGAGRQRGGFDVPAPGGRFSGGRGAHTGVKVTLVLCACLVATGIVGYMAFSLGISTMRANTYRLSEADIARYRLTDFPLDQAGRFAADYARICLTHDATPGATDQREAQLARYVSSGTDPTCGWNGEGTQTVTDAAWTGESEPIDVEGYAGKTRMMTVRVLTSTGSRVVTVPVYVEDLESGDGMRIVGDVGEMPQPTLADAPEPAEPGDVDGGLGEALVQGEFFQQFFTAWGDSNRPALQRFMTPDATSRTSSGLGGTSTEPSIGEARVFLPEGADQSDGTYDWKTGEVADAWVWVSWRTPGAGQGTVETRAYRLQLVKTTQAASPSQEWAVRDIRGGVPDVKGG